MLDKIGTAVMAQLGTKSAEGNGEAAAAAAEVAAADAPEKKSRKS